MHKNSFSNVISLFQTYCKSGITNLILLYSKLNGSPAKAFGNA